MSEGPDSSKNLRGEPLNRERSEIGFPGLITESQVQQALAIWQESKEYSLRETLLMYGHLQAEYYPLDIPENIQSRYWVLQKISRCSMGTVYQAWDSNLNRLVALKLVDKEQLTAELLSCPLAHPNIVTIYDVLEHEGKSFLCMEWIVGMDLARYVHTHGPMRWEQVQKILLPIAKALAYVHERAILHGDIKPGNFILGNEDSIKLIDFGIASSLKGESKGDYATLEFASPEQRMQQPLTSASDIYSLGQTLSYLLTGKTYSTTEFPSIKKFLYSRYKSSIPAFVFPLLTKMLHPRPVYRYKDANQLLREIETLSQRRPFPWLWALLFFGLLLMMGLVIGKTFWERFWKSPTTIVAIERLDSRKPIFHRLSQVLIAWDGLSSTLQAKFPPDTQDFLLQLLPKSRVDSSFTQAEKSHLRQIHEICRQHRVPEMLTLQEALTKLEGALVGAER